MKVNPVDLKKGDKIFRYRDGKIEKFEIKTTWNGSPTICVIDGEDVKYIRCDFTELFDNFHVCWNYAITDIDAKIQKLNKQKADLYKIY